MRRKKKLIKQLDYIKNSPERVQLEKALKTLKSQIPLASPIFINGQPQTSTTRTLSQPLPAEHAKTFTNYPIVNSEQINTAIQSALDAKKEWANTPFVDRVAIFMRAAELVAGKYRYELIAATMLGQGKNVWQGEIDAAAELADFFRLNCNLAGEILEKQPDRGTAGMWTYVLFLMFLHVGDGQVLTLMLDEWIIDLWKDSSTPSPRSTSQPLAETW